MEPDRVKKAKILLVDDIEEIRDHFQNLLAGEKDFEVIGTASSGREAVRLAEELSPDIVLSDIEMETPTAGIEAIKEIKAVDSSIKCLVLTIHEDDEFLFKAYAAGAMDYILKTDSIVRVLSSLRNAAESRFELRPEIAEKILKEFSKIKKQQNDLVQTLNTVSNLTTAEYEILLLFRKKYSYKRIARERFVEEVTIRSQVSKILRKFEKKRIKDVITTLEEFDIFDIYRGQDDKR